MPAGRETCPGIVVTRPHFAHAVQLRGALSRREKSPAQNAQQQVAEGTSAANVTMASAPGRFTAGSSAPSPTPIPPIRCERRISSRAQSESVSRPQISGPSLFGGPVWTSGLVWGRPCFQIRAARPFCWRPPVPATCREPGTPAPSTGPVRRRKTSASRPSDESASIFGVKSWPDPQRHAPVNCPARGS